MEKLSDAELEEMESTIRGMVLVVAHMSPRTYLVEELKRVLQTPQTMMAWLRARGRDEVPKWPVNERTWNSPPPTKEEWNKVFGAKVGGPA